MNYLDLFHGIGGFALGAYWAGMKFEHHYCSDIEPWCQELYEKRFPDSVQLGDITKIDTSKLPAGDWIITGGFPCQDISIAGKGAGIHGERSGLWFEYWRIINDLRPRFAIMENVGMLVHRGLREVLGSLAEIGYDAEWQDIRASDVGAPHRRERIWIVAYPDNTRADRCRVRNNRDRAQNDEKRIEGIESISESKIPHPSLQLSHGSGKTRNWRDEYTDRIAELRNDGYTEQQIEHELAGGDVADAPIPRLEGQESTRGGPGESGLPTECGDELSNAEGWKSREQAEREGRESFSGRDQENGRSEWWSTEPDVGMLVNGLPSGLDRFEGRLSSNAHRRVDQLKGLGNSIVPQIAELLFRQIFAKTS